MNRIHCAHAQPTFAFRQSPLTLTLFVPDREVAVADIALRYSVSLLGGNGGAQAVLRMLPADGFFAEESFSLYSAVIPAKDLVGGELSYCFLRDGIESESYTVPLCDEPLLPPLQITEYAAHAAAPANFIELYNPGESTVDLYDYELLLFCNGELAGRNPLGDDKGQNLLGAGKLAVLRYIAPSLLSHEDFAATGREQFLRDMERLYPEDCGDIAERGITFFEVTITQKGQNGATFLREGCFEPPALPHPAYRLLIVPRGKGEQEAVFSLAADKRVVSDALACRSSLWDASAREPSVAFCTEESAPATPGWAEMGQRLLRRGDTMPPAVLPLEPAGRVFLTGKDLKICFAVVGEHFATPQVFVRTAGGFARFAAKQGWDGLYRAVVPYLTLSRIKGRFEYYIKVAGGMYVASCGDKLRPISLRMVDHAGPAVLSVYPAQGEVMAQEASPLLRIAYEDISGVDRRACVLCLDGINISAFAKWGVNGVEYQPKKPLKRGEHVIEVLLRDKLGNRTYQRSTFVVEGKTARRVREPSAKKARRHERMEKVLRVALVPVQAAALVVEAVAAAKEFFHTRDDKK